MSKLSNFCTCNKLDCRLHPSPRSCRFAIGAFGTHGLQNRASGDSNGVCYNKHPILGMMVVTRLYLSVTHN